MLVGLCGMPNAGKSEVTNILCEKYAFEILDTKEILREISGIITDRSSSLFVTQEDKRMEYCGVTHRKIMGEVGNMIESLWGDSFLLDRALQRLDRYNFPSRRIVVDSLRKSQPKNFPGLVIEVVSDKAIDTGNDFDKYDKSRINGLITNMGTLEELEESIKRALKL